METYTLYDCGMNVYCNPAYGCQITINVYVMLTKQMGVYLHSICRLHNRKSLMSHIHCVKYLTHICFYRI